MSVFFKIEENVNTPLIRIEHFRVLHFSRKKKIYSFYSLNFSCGLIIFVEIEK